MSRDGEERKTGISVRTLAIASASSATATLVVPMFWQPGTLPAAAITPIVVALVSEALNRPKLPVTLVRPVAGGGGETRREDRFGLFAPDRRRRLLRAGVVTGLLAFLVVGAVWTVGELAAGESLSGGGRTTYFGGEARESESSRERAPDATATPGPGEATPAEPEDTPEPDEEATPTPTPTVTPQGTATPTPAPTVAPQATPPATTTPAP